MWFQKKTFTFKNDNTSYRLVFADFLFSHVFENYDFFKFKWKIENKDFYVFIEVFIIEYIFFYKNNF